MNAATSVDDLIASLADWRGAALADIRRVIHKADPHMREEWKWMGTPVWSDDGIVCIANAYKDKVKLTFPQGASLADPEKLFNNGLTGKQWRAIDIYKDDKINEESLDAIIRVAVACNHSRTQSTKRPHAARGDPKKKP